MEFDTLLAEADATTLATLIRSGEVSSRELIEASAARIAAFNPTVNAVVHQCVERALREADALDVDAPFAGVPFLLKDLIAGYRGEPLGNGSRSYRGFTAPDNAPLVQRYLDAGLIVIGKTNTPEFGLMPVTEPQANGVTVNPWDRTRTAGGSSGGAGAAVATGMVSVAHGGDGGGSIRIPASCCGLFGLKPSRGRNPRNIPYAVWLDGVVEHVLSRSVRDSAALLDVTAHDRVLARPPDGFLTESTRPPGKLRIGVLREPLLSPDFAPACEDALNDAVGLCESLGHDLIDATPEIDRERFGLAFAEILCAEVSAEIARAETITGRRLKRTDFEASTWALGVIGRSMRAFDLVQAQREIQTQATMFIEFSRQFDVLLTPTLGQAPLPHGEFQPAGVERVALSALGTLRAGRVLRMAGMLETLARDSFRFIPSTPMFNMTGQPAASVPLFWTDQPLPIGVQFSAQVGEEVLLLRLARQLEQARPWIQRYSALARTV